MAVSTIERVGPRQTKRGLEAGELLLVNAYDDAAKAAKFPIPGAIGLAELKQRIHSVPLDQEIVFYCG